MRKAGHSAVKIEKKDLMICAGIILLTALFLWNFRFVRVDGESMIPTLSNGQILLASTHKGHRRPHCRATEQIRVNAGIRDQSAQRRSGADGIARRSTQKEKQEL